MPPPIPGKQRMVQTIIVTVVVCVCTWIALSVLPLGYYSFLPRIRNYFRRLPFDSASWRDEQRVYSDDPIRKRMLPSLLRTHNLVGRSTDEIRTLLGPPMDRLEYLYYAPALEKHLPSNAMVYWIGDEEGFMAFDSIWFILTPDATGVISNYWETRAGLQHVRNPRCDDTLGIARIDPAAHHISVVTGGEFDPSIPAAWVGPVHWARAYATKCLPSWAQDWSASFFDDASFAGYKNQLQLPESAGEGAAASAHLAEYDNSRAQLTLHPALPSRKVFSLQLGP